MVDNSGNSQTEPGEVQETEIVNRRPERSNSVLVGLVILAVVVTIGLIAYFAHTAISLQTVLGDAKATAAKLEASNKQLTEYANAQNVRIADLLAKIPAANSETRTEETKDTEHDMAAKAATTAPKVKGTFAIVIGTLYRPSQRKLFQGESAAALDTCSDDNIKLEYVLSETGDTKHTRHETKALAAVRGGMTEKQAQAKAACLHENLPQVVKRDQRRQGR